MSEHFHGHRKRLKDRFTSTPESLHDYEIVELLLGYVVKGKDVKPYAKELFSKNGGIGNFFKNKPSDIKGLGKECDTFFTLLQELFRRISLENLKDEKDVLDSPERVFSFLKYQSGYSDKEQFIVIFLNSSNAVVDFEIIAEGTVNQASVYPREIAQKALEKNATATIICHNHPSGNLKPSGDDVKITKKITEGLSLFDIMVLDHLIINSKDYFSFKKEGYL